MRRPNLASGRASTSRRRRNAIIEALERRALLSASYSTADIAGDWSLQGMNFAGTATFDGKGNVIGGSFTKLDGSIQTPSGNYTVDPAGVVSILNTPPPIGAINSSKDVFAVSNIQPG